MARLLVEGIRDDHVMLKDLLSLVVKGVPLLEEGSLSLKTILELLEALEEFLSKYHFIKEELVLFPALEGAGMNYWEGPLSLLTCDHGIVMYLLRNSRFNLERVYLESGGQLPLFKKYINMMVDYFKGHIEKEEGVVLRIAGSVLEPNYGVEQINKIEAKFNRRALMDKIESLKREIEGG